MNTKPRCCWLKSLQLLLGPLGTIFSVDGFIPLSLVLLGGCSKDAKRNFQTWWEAKFHGIDTKLTILQKPRATRSGFKSERLQRPNNTNQFRLVAFFNYNDCIYYSQKLAIVKTKYANNEAQKFLFLTKIPL